MAKCYANWSPQSLLQLAPSPKGINHSAKSFWMTTCQCNKREVGMLYLSYDCGASSNLTQLCSISFFILLRLLSGHCCLNTHWQSKTHQPPRIGPTFSNCLEAVSLRAHEGLLPMLRAAIQALSRLTHQIFGKNQVPTRNYSDPKVPGMDPLNGHHFGSHG